MRVRVYKFGGASLADTEKLKAVAQFLKTEKQRHQDPILAVVSAMGKTTDQLIALAKQVSAHPQRRELDMLLTVGERTSMSLLSLALNDLGVTAISFTGSQAGIITDNAHGNARILQTRPFRIEQHLKNGTTVVLAGFQGVSDDTKEITTLGRGGTDTTAVAMASYFQSPVCEFKKDVGGLFSADPKIVNTARPLPKLTFKNVVDMTFWGAKFLHYRAAELALALKLPLRFSHFQNEDEFTMVSGDSSMLEQQKIISINSHQEVHAWTFPQKTLQESLSWLNTQVQKHSLPAPQVLAATTVDQKTRVLFVGEVGDLAQTLQFTGLRQKFSSVTATCQGAVSSDLLGKVMDVLKSDVLEVLQDTTNLTVFVKTEHRESTIQKMHSLL